MQTFLPDPDFRKSAAMLDRSRLGKQRLEALHLLRILRGEAMGPGWANHPALRMWRGHADSLAEYGIAVCLEWKARGYVDNLLPEFRRLRGPGPAKPPPWLGDKAFHASHRSNLLRKDPLHYARFGWKERPDLPYVWPVGRPLPPVAPGAGTDAGAGRRTRVAAEGPAGSQGRRAAAGARKAPPKGRTTARPEASGDLPRKVPRRMDRH